MEGVFSRECLIYLLEKNIPVGAIILPLRSGITGKRLPLRNLLGESENLHDLAMEAGIPCYELDKINTQSVDPVFSSIQPTLIVVACFPLRIPADVYKRPLYGAYNLHPSLLPEYRGPVPLFWQFYYGERNTGVTLHLLDEEYDTGDIVYQAPVIFPDGITGEEANRVTARKSAELVLRLLEALETGIPEGMKQVPGSGSYFSWPKVEQFSISTQWSAIRAYNFICATRHWNQLYTIRTTRGKYCISSALSVDPNQLLGSDVAKRNHEVLFQFNPGVLVTLLPKHNT